MKIIYSILSGLIFALIVFLYLAFTSKMDIAIVIGIFIFLISPFMFYFKIFYNIDFKSKFNKIDRKKVLYFGLSNYDKNGIQVGGTLYLHDDKLIFQTNLINFTHRHQQIIFLKQISKISLEDSMGFIKNGLQLKSVDGQVIDFIVYKRDIWKGLIEKQMALNNQSINKL